LSLEDIEARVAAVQTDQGVDLIYDLMLAYGLPKASIARLKSGTYDRSSTDGEVLWKGKVYYSYVRPGEADLHDVIDTAKSDPRVIRNGPRFLIARDDVRLLAQDRRTGDSLDIPLEDLASSSAFFLPWAGLEKTQITNASLADIRAAEKMARLYDEITQHNTTQTAEDIHHLNVFFSRLLFCFFAEDTSVFTPGQFSDAVGSLTQASGTDVHDLLDRLFLVLNTPPDARQGLPAYLRDFGYVNGNLFNEPAPSPRFSSKARRILLECGTLDWAQINPDIFGSMIQAVVHPGQREGLGMHYTSVENIMKVIRPLFLDDLEDAFREAHADKGKLRRLLDRIARIRVFDPACGSGNFLVIAYKELRRLEHEVLARLHEVETGSPPRNAPQQLFPEPRVRLEHFYGIEIDDFAHEIATLSLWLAKHQMNLEYRSLFDVILPLIPLRETGHIYCGNAARLDWASVLSRDTEADEIYLLGNPPYLGGTRQTTEHKEDLVQAFGDPNVNKYLDYVSIWLIKGAAFVEQQDARLGFVVTNSVCQGNHVGLLWPRLAERHVDIAFAHSSFLWSNNAKRNAGVTCVIIGLAPKGRTTARYWYGGGRRRRVQTINAYLVPDGSDVIVTQTAERLNGLPAMVFGSMPRDGGGLVLTALERKRLLEEAPHAERFVRRYTGASEFINGIDRYCLWIDDKDAAEARAIPALAARFDAVSDFRRRSEAQSTRQFATQPHRFVQRAHQETSSIIVPRVSSQRRDYIPMGFLDRGTVISDAANAIYGAEPWLFALIQSRIHMVWVRAVAGRLKTDYRYSAVLVYNTFPVPRPSDAQKTALTDSVMEVLAAREQFAASTLAELYDPTKMPDNLRGSHAVLDRTVDSLYRSEGFLADAERLETLFRLYEEMTSNPGGGRLAEPS
jgi:hypothetical protein